MTLCSQTGQGMFSYERKGSREEQKDGGRSRLVIKSTTGRESKSIWFLFGIRRISG